MGACTNKSKTHKEKEQQYIHLLDIDNPNNINNKYVNDITLIHDKYIGNGFKRTNLYITNLSKKELNQLQKSFWGREFKQYKRLTKIIQIGKQQEKLLHKIMNVQIFKFIRDSAQQILQLRRLRMIQNSIQLIIADSNIEYKKIENIYQVPVFLINEPVAWQNENIIFDFEITQITVRIKSSKLPQNFELTIQNSQTIQEIKELILSQIKEKTTCRLFLNGRELIEQNQLGNYNITSGTIIQAFL